MRTEAAMLCALLLAAAPAGSAALTVGLAPARPVAGPADAPPPMDGIVTGCLDAFFDAGYIGTDAACAVIQRGGWEEKSFGLAAAREGLVDYLVAFYATWRRSAFDERVWLVLQVDYRIVRVADGRVVGAGSLAGPPDSARAAAEAEKSARGLGASLGAACAAILASPDQGGKQ